MNQAEESQPLRQKGQSESMDKKGQLCILTNVTLPNDCWSCSIAPSSILNDRVNLVDCTLSSLVHTISLRLKIHTPQFRFEKGTNDAGGNSQVSVFIMLCVLERPQERELTYLFLFSRSTT